MQSAVDKAIMGIAVPREGCPMVLDGAMGTELARMGATAMGKPGWTVRPHFSAAGVEAIKVVHRRYRDAGADVLCTHTYNLCDTYVETNNLGPELEKTEGLEELQRQAVRIAREVSQEGQGGSQRRCKVAAVLGPYGAAACPGGDYSFDYSTVSDETLRAFHRRRAAALTAAGPDVLLFETQVSLKELRAIIDVIHELSAPAWVAFTCGSDGKTATGESWEDVVRAAEASPLIQALGVNCTWPLYCEKLLADAKELSTKPLIVYPNNGVWNKENLEWDLGDSASFSQWIKQLIRAGDARIVGGCCGVTPDDIQALTASLRAEAQTKPFEGD